MRGLNILNRLNRAIRLAWQDSRGSVAVEAALVLPVLFTFCFGVIEVGRAMWIQNSLQEAVDSAARCAVVNTAGCANAGQVKAHAVDMVNGFAVDATNFVVTTPACGKQVSATYSFTSSAGVLLPLSLTLRAQSCRPYRI